MKIEIALLVIIISITIAYFSPLIIHGAIAPSERTFTIINASDKPIEIVLIHDLFLWGAKVNSAIELDMGTYRRPILPNEVLRWNKIIGENLTMRILDPGKSLETPYTYRADPDTPVIAGPLWIVRDKLYSYADFINLLGLMSRYKKIRLEAKPQEIGFYRLTAE